MTPRRDGSNGSPLLSVRDLRTRIRTDDGWHHAVDGVSFDVERGETVCLVGESGSGKSVTCESLTGLVPQPPAEVSSDGVAFDGESVADRSEAELRSIRGRRIAHVFQNPQSALDPVYTVGKQVTEPIRIHEDVSRSGARDRAVDLLRRVGIPRAAERLDSYPHEFSGGMRQRIAIAVALSGDPDLLIADEPTTAVDVTVQARLLDLFRSIVGDGTSVLLVTHDLRVVAAVADRVLVMYGGTIVERGPVGAVFDAPSHPYTQALFDSYGTGDRAAVAERTARGGIPTDGCRFRAECPHAVEECAGGAQPAFHAVGDSPDHAASCVHYGPEGDPSAIRENATSPVESRAERESRRSAVDRSATSAPETEGERR
ncbi:MULTISPECIES: ABC transporter ATP-binding protein [Halorubrum]|uniref:Nickel import system ATP-binding protein NikD n=1 Tax=Halorubrum hochstenium ATCC 700873 TaxID=1227481 RepID=M0FMZ6_9EURY|nr:MULTISPECIES: ABC transporter ATP-binding protein [Halorubrum]ELZ59959.1 oligopeptide/dipeptide ABC transporter ATPase [Halorubrum hochstenium ATCC 700873]